MTATKAVEFIYSYGTRNHGNVVAPCSTVA